MRSSKGLALIVVLILTAVILSLAATMAKISLDQRKISSLFLSGEAAFYLAEGGVEEAQWLISSRGNKFEPELLSYKLPSGYNDIKDWFRGGDSATFKRETDLGLVRGVKKKGSNSCYIFAQSGEGEKFLELKYSFPPFKVMSLKEF